MTFCAKSVKVMGYILLAGTAVISLGTCAVTCTEKRTENNNAGKSLYAFI
jgi:hypothetical protein